MKARGLNKIMKEDREVCANHLLTTLTAEEAARLALRVFPVGSLAGGTFPGDPYRSIKEEFEYVKKTEGYLSDLFTGRELEIIKMLIWQTDTMEQRVFDAKTIAAMERGGATFDL
jgi:hypothetical protein